MGYITLKRYMRSVLEHITLFPFVVQFTLGLRFMLAEFLHPS